MRLTHFIANSVENAMVLRAQALAEFIYFFLPHQDELKDLNLWRCLELSSSISHESDQEIYSRLFAYALSQEET